MARQFWNRTIDTPGFRSSFEQHGRVHIENVLLPSVAKAIRRSIDRLTHDNRWYRAQYGHPLFAARRRSVACSHFAYQFDKFPISHVTLRGLVGAAGDSRRHDHAAVLKFASQPERELAGRNILRQFGDFLNSSGCLGFIRDVTGAALPERATTCFVSRFIGGDFLAAHDDGLSGRVITFTFGFTRRWLPHWGGHTLFMHNPNSHVVEAVLPTFNTLTLFAVPMIHCVCPVSIYAQEERIMVTGWFNDSTPQ